MVKAAGFAAAAVAAAPAADALVDYPGLPYLGGGDKIDVNNANIRAYLRLPGMYPSIAGKITSQKQPFKSVGDIYQIKSLTGTSFVRALLLGLVEPIIAMWRCASPYGNDPNPCGALRPPPNPLRYASPHRPRTTLPCLCRPTSHPHSTPTSTSRCREADP